MPQKQLAQISHLPEAMLPTWQKSNVATTLKHTQRPLDCNEIDGCHLFNSASHRITGAAGAGGLFHDDKHHFLGGTPSYVPD
jgi:hypothetical protein